MPRISQRALNQDALIYMEKTAAGKGGKTPNPVTFSNEFLQGISRLVGSSGRKIIDSSGTTQTPSTMLKALNDASKAENGGKGKYLKQFTDEIEKVLRKKLEKSEIAKAKKQVYDGTDLLSETGKVLLEGGGQGKNQGLGSAAGAGAGLGALAGAFQDTDDEQTNMLGVTQKRKGKLMDRIKNMAAGAAIGGAAGAGLKAKGIAKNKLTDSVKNLSKGGRESIKNMSSENLINEVLNKYAPTEIDNDIVKAISKAHQNFLKDHPKKNKNLSEALNKHLFDKSLDDIGGFDPKYNGRLEKLWDFIRGGEARRNMKADDTYNALATLSGVTDENLAENLRKLQTAKGSVGAFKALNSSPFNIDLGGETLRFKDKELDAVASILNHLYSSSADKPEFAKLFQDRRTGIALPGKRNVIGRDDNSWFGAGNIYNTIAGWLGYKSPNRLQNYYDELVRNSDAIL